MKKRIIELPENASFTYKTLNGKRVIEIFEDILSKKEVLIEEARNRGFKKGARIKNKIITDEELFMDYNFVLHNFGESLIAICGIEAIPIWTKEKGWEEITEPLFTNSLGERFYEGERVWWVIKSRNELTNNNIDNLSSFGSNSGSTEIMTEKSAKKWMEDNKPKKDSNYDCQVKYNFKRGR